MMDTPCELCGGPVRGTLCLTSDSHPEGPNLLVCEDCLDYEAEAEA